MSPRLGAVLLALLPLALLADCARNPATGEANFVLMSEQQELSPGRRAEATLRLINARYPTGEPKSGQAIKLLE